MTRLDSAPTIPGWRHLATGKVRDLYVPEAQDGAADGATSHLDAAPHALLLVASDRISAFDYLLEPAITGKGELLTTLSNWWFDRIPTPNHLVSAMTRDSLPEVPLSISGRAMLTTRLHMVEVECVVRGAVTGSGFAEYQATGAICGIHLPPGLADGDLLDEPIFTPAWKAPQGEHDENISFDRVVELVGAETAEALRDTSLAIFRDARDRAADRGLLLADTKFEFGRHPVTGVLTLADEVLTSDSSRYWDLAAYEDDSLPQPERLASFDKQIVRNWLLAHWDRKSPPPRLPDTIVDQTLARYRELVARLTGDHSLATHA